MSHFSLPLTRLIHENLSIVMSFAYSRKPLSHLMDAKFKGESKYLNKALFEVSAERADKACLELALFLRMFDDEENFRLPHCYEAHSELRQAHFEGRLRESSHVS